MAMTLTTPNTLLGVLQPKTDTAKLASNAAIVVIGTLLLTLSAKINVPVWPVPVTLQTFAVAALAAAFGWRIGVATVVLYLIEGALGLPVFARGGGLPYLLGPTGGFLVAYIPMAYIIGLAADRGTSGNPLKLFGWMLLADVLVFAIGFLWLLTVANLIVQGGGELPAWLAGGDLMTVAWNGAVQPFIVWDILKMALAALTVAGGWTLLKRRG